MQMQDAAINSSNTSSYGDGTAGGGAGYTSLNNAGLYEFVNATSAVSSGSVAIEGDGAGGGLLYTYTNAAATTTQGQRRFQVIRVPRYTDASLSSSTALTATAWSTTTTATVGLGTGGVVALDVAGELDLNGGTIDVSGQGFRGGGGRLLQWPQG